MTTLFEEVNTLVLKGPLGISEAVDLIEISTNQLLDQEMYSEIDDLLMRVAWSALPRRIWLAYLVLTNWHREDLSNRDFLANAMKRKILKEEPLYTREKLDEIFADLC